MSLQSTSEPKSATRGRPPTDAVDRFRSKVWYRAIKFKGEERWSDYQLDIEFAREEGEPKRDGENRRRAFKGIGRHGRVPSSGNHPKRPYDLVVRVDAHPCFSGTASSFRSAFWELLKSDAMGLSEAHAFVSRCMATSQVHRPTGKFEMAMKMLASGRQKTIRSFNSSEIYRAALKQIVAGRPLDLDILALVGGLFREAYLACSLNIAVVLQDLFLDRLSDYCQQEWLGELGSELLEFAENRLFYWRVDNKSLCEELYDTLPKWAIARPLLSIDENTRSLIENEDRVYDKLMEEFIEAIGYETTINLPIINP